MSTPRFQVGTHFVNQKKRLCVVTDIWITTNLAGEVVKVRYVATHQFMGQTVADFDVLETTIAKGVVTEPITPKPTPSPHSTT